MFKYIVSLMLLMLCSTSFAGWPLVAKRDSGASLYDFVYYQKLCLNDVACLVVGSDNPTSVAKNAPAGSIYLRTNGTAYLKTDAGSSTNWTLMAAGSGLTALTGDVTASGSGSQAATVAAVGGSTAAAVHTSQLATVAATDANTASVIVKRDANKNAQFGALGMVHVSAGIDNAGFGETSGSMSSTYPAYIQRTLATPIIMLLDNPSTAAGSGTKIQEHADNGGSTFEMGLFATATTAPDAYNGGRATVRCTDGCVGISAVSDAAATSDFKFYMGGNGASNLVMTVDQFGLKWGTLATKPTCDSGARGREFFTKSASSTADQLEMCMKKSDDSYAWVVVKAAP